jgi:type III pantothenate kinase
MHNLVIDIGNTKSKVSVFKEKELLYYQAIPKPETAIILELIQEFGVDGSIVSNVGTDRTDLTNLLKEKTRYIEFSTGKNPGIRNAYRTKPAFSRTELLCY